MSTPSTETVSELDAAPLTIVRLDQEGRITRVNEAWRKFARENGGNAETASGVGIDYLAVTEPATVDLPDGQRVATLFRDLISGKREGLTCVYPCHSPTEVRWFKLDAQRIATDRSIVLVHTNITDQFLAEGRLSVQAVVTQALAERAPLEETCRRLIRATCEGLAWDFAAIWMPVNGVGFSCVETWATPDFDATGFDEAIRNHPSGLAERVRLSLSPQWIADLGADAHFDHAVGNARDGLRTGFAVPLGAEGEVFAIVEFFSRIQRAPDLALMELLTTSGAQLGTQVLRERAEQRARDAEGNERRAGVASKEREQRFQQILDAITDLVLVKGPGSKILWANTAFRELYGMSNEELQGLIDAPFNEPDYTQQYIKDDAWVFKSGKTLVIPNEPVTRFDGAVQRFRTTKSPILDDNGQVVMLVGVSHDITEQLRTEDQLRLADRMASVGSMAAGVAHEINTPVQFVNDSVHFLREATEDIFGVVEKLQKVAGLASQLTPTLELSNALAEAASAQETADLGYLHSNVPTAFERSIDGLERVSTIVRSMKEFAHPQQREMAPTDLNRAIQNTLVISANEYKYIAQLETSFGEIPYVTCYVNDINQVVLNIIVNASHAIAEAVKGTNNKGTLRVATHQEGDQVIISISDTGAGIPSAIAQRIFEPFFTTKEVGKGTGQGLALAWAVVKEKHGGELRFESELGQGTTFFIHLPIEAKALS